MRLTLRTLLGYLDDILEPQQTRELGEKISESGVASTLVARIKDVVRRRRIGAPEVSGSGSDPDPNIVAEYLDNTLSPEKVEDLERLCLESDTHLAEVAACHQILTLVLGEPVDVSSTIRERMYALGTVAAPGEAARLRAAGSSLPAPSSPGPAVTAPTPSPAPAAVPDYLRSGANWKRLLLGAAAILVLGLWLGLIVSDPSQPWRVSGTPTSGERAPDSTPAAPAAGKAVAAGPSEVQPIEPVVAADTTGQEPSVPPNAAAVAPAIAGEPGQPPVPPGAGPTAPPPTIAGAAPMPTPTIPTTTVSPAPPGAQMPAGAPVVAGDAVPGGAAATPGLPAPETLPTPAAAQNPPPVAAATPSKVLYNSVEGVLLNLDPTGEWRVLPRRSLLHTGDQVANPEPFESVLQVLDTDAEVVLHGGTRITLQPITGAAQCGLDVDQGRLVFRRQLVVPGAEPVRLQLQLAAQTYELELLDAGTECGLEVRPLAATGPMTEPLPPGFDGSLFLTTGSARITTPEGTVLPLTAGANLLVFIDGRPLTTLQPLNSPPDWMLPLTGGAATVARATSRQFEEAFQPALPVSETIPALVESRHPRIADLAARTLVVTDQVRPLVRALSAPHEEARKDAILGLGVWLRRHADQSDMLTDEINRVFPAETAVRINRLLWGYAPQDGRDPEISRQLVEWLGDPSVAVRELAFYQIGRLVPGAITYRYHPDRPDSQRAASIRQWEQHLRKEGALVPPGPAAATPDAASPAGRTPLP